MGGCKRRKSAVSVAQLRLYALLLLLLPLSTEGRGTEILGSSSRISCVLWTLFSAMRAPTRCRRVVYTSPIPLRRHHQSRVGCNQWEFYDVTR